MPATINAEKNMKAEHTYKILQTFLLPKPTKDIP